MGWSEEGRCALTEKHSISDGMGPSDEIAETIFQQGSQAHVEGRLEDAESAYRQVLELLPNDAQAMHLLAAIVGARGGLKDAEALLVRSIELDSGDPAAWASWAFLAVQGSDETAAIERLERAFELDPATPGVAGLLTGLLAKHADREKLDAVLRAAMAASGLNADDLSALEEPLHRLSPSVVVELCRIRATQLPDEAWWRVCMARAFRRQGDDAAAVRLLREALALEPDRVRSIEMLIEAQIAMGDDAAAAETAAMHLDTIEESAVSRIFTQSGRSLSLWVAVCSKRGDRPGPWLQRAGVEIGLGLHAEAERSLRQLLTLEPTNAVALNNLGLLRSIAGDEAEARVLLERAVAVDPGFVEARINLGYRLHQEGLWDRACSILRGNGSGRSEDLRLRLGSAIARLKIAWESEEELAAGRLAYLEDLAAIEEDLNRDRVRPPSPGTAEPLSLTPFYVAYLGHDDVPPQTSFGRIMDRLVHGWLGAEARLDPPDPPGRGERVRVGFLSSHFHEHSVWKVITKGWLEGLDANRFELFGYSTGHVRDRISLEARSRFAAFRDAAGSSREWVRLVRRDRPHLMIFPEIGMEARSALLAATRLAPVQATSWGHSITSGLPSMDWFLGSEFMEPEAAQANYTERLQLLPNLSVQLQPVEVLPQGRSRAELGFDEDDVVYWCCQSVFKYLPRHDHVFAEIAAGVPNARFAFLESRRFPGAMQIFKARLTRAFQRLGLSAERHCRFLPQHASGPLDVFGDCCRLADVFLDCPDWSGCNTTLESMTFGMPVVTLPGRTMRTRQTAGILRMMGLSEMIASDVGSFVSLATRLGRDRPMRQEIRGRILDRRPSLYGDRAPVDALASWIEHAARSAG